MTELKSRRLQRKITQKEAAERIGISLRSYIMYENDESKEGTPKYRFLLQEMDRIILLDESHGILSIEEIKQKCADVFALYFDSKGYKYDSRLQGADAILCPEYFCVRLGIGLKIFDALYDEKGLLVF